MSRAMRREKGTVGIEAKAGRLRVRLPRHLFEGQQKYVSLLTDDTPKNRQKALETVRSIERDIAHGCFDVSLVRYKPRNAVTLSIVDSRKTLKAVYDEYVTYKMLIKPNTSPCTVRTVYNQTKNCLERCPYSRPDDAQKIKEWCLSEGSLGSPMSADSTKRFLVQLAAACKYGMNKGLLLSNPFVGLMEDLSSGNKKDDEEHINPFSKDEVEAIFKAFEESRYYSHYADFVKFLFYTGCRPSEAIALQAKHIASNKIVFEQAIVPTTGKATVLKDGLKRQKKRELPMNAQLRDLMARICSGKPEDEFLFLGARGSFIDISNFSQRGWKGTLDKLPIVSRNLYQTRHTAITMWVEANVPIAQVAKWVGNSSEVIMRHYLGITNQNALPPAM